MKTLLQKTVWMAIAIYTFSNIQETNAQCSSGYTSAQLNFDMHYLETTSLPSSPLNFAIGKNSMRFAWSGGSNNVLNGVNGTHTGESGSNGAGDDIEFDVRNGADTLVFDKEVSNVSFSVYDIDRNQVMNVKAYNAAGTAVNIGLARVRSGTLTITGNGTTSATATADGDSRGNSATHAVANVDIAGPVKTIVLTFTRSPSGTDPIWISDISVCNDNSTTGTWANGYQAISTPEIGQPSYILASYGDSIVAVDIVNNTSTLIHEVDNSILIDTLGRPKAINSLAYDPHNQIIYFADNSRARRNIAIYKYDVKTGVRTTFIADVRNIGIQLFGNGMGSGGSAYYDGALYVGIDMTNTSGSPEPVTVYRIEVDSSTGNPGIVSRVWSKVGYDGSTMYYDWADFVINNGVFYNFNSMSTRASNTGLEHINLNTNSVTNGYDLTSTIIGGSQSGIDYQGNVYHFINNTLQLYNGAGSFGGVVSYTGVSGMPLTDIAEAFKFPYDYGDAPSSYGTAYHLYKTSPNLKLGSLIDYEVSSDTDTLATGDDTKNTGAVNDEDGISSFPTLTTAYASYALSVNVTNTTGINAILYGYIDFNSDGVFDTITERSLPTIVANGASSVTVTWSGLTGLIAGSSFARFRLASSDAEARRWSGYAGTGEVEDYPITIEGSSLPVEITVFTAREQEDKTVNLNWTTASEYNNDYFDVLHSSNGIEWISMGQVNGNGNTHWTTEYSFTDEYPFDGITYYMLKQVDFDKSYQNSPIISLKTAVQKEEIKEDVYSIYPNPTSHTLWIKNENEEMNLDADPKEAAIFSITGEMMDASEIIDNPHKLDLSEYSEGVYFIRIGDEVFKFIKK